MRRRAVRSAQSGATRPPAPCRRRRSRSSVASTSCDRRSVSTRASTSTGSCWDPRPPQRHVWIRVASSGARLLLCPAPALGLLSRRRRAARAAEPPGNLDEAPAFRSPLVASGTRPRNLVVAAPAIGSGLVAAVLIKPLPGLLVGLLVLAALVRPPWRVLLAIGAPLALGIAGLYVVLEQTLNEYPPVFEWPTFFDRVHVLGWLAVALLAADALVEVVRTRRRRPGEPPASG